MALRAPDVQVSAITVVAGNVDLEQATRNALYTVELCGANVPVYAGAAKPLVRAYQNATWFHGRDGLGDHNYPAPAQLAKDNHAVDAIIETIEGNPGLVLVTLGPLTNIALAVSRNPAIVSKVGRCVVMGGAPCCEGNVTPAAEYNIWVDPEAAGIVMRSGLPVELIGWHLCRGGAVRAATTLRTCKPSTPSSRISPLSATAMRARLTKPKPVKMEFAFRILWPCVSPSIPR